MNNATPDVALFQYFKIWQAINNTVTYKKQGVEDGFCGVCFQQDCKQHPDVTTVEYEDAISELYWWLEVSQLEAKAVLACLDPMVPKWPTSIVNQPHAAVKYRKVGWEEGPVQMVYSKNRRISTIDESGNVNVMPDDGVFPDGVHFGYGNLQNFRSIAVFNDGYWTAPTFKANPPNKKNWLVPVGKTTQAMFKQFLSIE